ncbi:restriction endonuclease [Halorhabdus rudnickae]|uniref:restriction endonuclease n=1 Tax=Halorhabdus rudnickae TaxID=1775544 RepID=UPI0010830D7E|nr:restriction endonuclease [Halorhabdus rudnickae]
MSQQQHPQWYQPGSITESIRRAIEDKAITTEQIVDVFATHELDAPRDRITTLVENARDQLPDNIETASSPTDTGPRRTSPSRIVSTADIAYLNAHDFARILGATLSRYEGSFQTPETVDDVVVDLFWNRQHTTVAIKTAPTDPGSTRGSDIVHTVAEGNTTPATGRGASSTVIVSNSSFTDDAHEVAEAQEITLIEQPTLDQWFTDVQLSHEVLGTIVEQHDLTQEEYDDILNDLPPLPSTLQEIDPLDRQPPNIEPAASTLNREFTHETPSETTGSNTSRDDQQSESDSAPEDSTESVLDTAPEEHGKHGVLYADPDEDGDVDAFDRFAAKLTEDSE